MAWPYSSLRRPNKALTNIPGRDKHTWHREEGDLICLFHLVLNICLHSFKKLAVNI